MSSLLFSYLRVPRAPSQKILEEVLSLSLESWFFDSYRSTWMLPLLTESGKTGKLGSLNQGGDLAWTSFAPASFVAYYEQFIAPWIGCPGRIMLLKTPQGQANAEHIDCTPNCFSSPQYKLRIVLQGNVDDLYFITKAGQLKIDFDQVGRLFVIDGRWPHGMKNTSESDKYTLCIGSPWNGEGLFHKGGLLEEKAQLSWNPSLLPDNYQKYFEDPLMRKLKLCQ